MNNREAFEAWYQNEYVQFGRANFHFNSYGEYFDDDIEASWCAWQAALALQQDHIGDNNKLVQSVNALAAQTGESPESITEWLTDKGGLTQLMLSHFGGMSSQAQQESQWFLIETAPKNKKIIVTYKNALGKNRTVFAKYIEKFTEESTLDTECETDYCEEDDTFYLKEGWVELIDNWDEFSSVYFDSQNVPTHWMDIPPAPDGDKP